MTPAQKSQLYDGWGCLLAEFAKTLNANGGNGNADMFPCGMTRWEIATAVQQHLEELRKQFPIRLSDEHRDKFLARSSQVVDL